LVTLQREVVKLGDVADQPSTGPAQ